MDRLLMVVSQVGGKYSCDYVGTDGDEADKAYQAGCSNDKLDGIRLYRWPAHSESNSPKDNSANAKAEAERAKRAEAEAIERERKAALEALDAASGVVKQAKAKLKELGMAEPK